MEIYVVLPNEHSDWDDSVIFLDKEEAVAYCKTLKGWRVEIFRQDVRGSSYGLRQESIEDSKKDEKDSLQRYIASYNVEYRN
jgi:hypothetical protein